MKGKPAHTLPSFTGYLNKVFRFREAIQPLRDARQDPEISPQSVFLAVFHSFLFRLPSFQQLEADLAEPSFQRQIGVQRAFGDDVLRYSLCGFDLEALQGMLVQINRRLKRNKAFEPDRVQGRIVAALDGIEVLSSYSRCCQFCLQRRVSVNDDDGHPVERIQYSHRAVGCQIVNSPVKPLLAVEWLRPGEGEDTAALRLLSQLPELYGSRFFDILLLDSLYAQAPVLQLHPRSSATGAGAVLPGNGHRIALPARGTHPGNHFPSVGLDHHLGGARLRRQDRLATGAYALEERKQRME